MEQRTPLVLSVDLRGWSLDVLKSFHQVAQKYQVKPIFLVGWDILQKAELVAFLAEVSEKQSGEVGILVDQEATPGATLEEKVAFLADAVERLTGSRPQAHRAANWCVDEPTFVALAKVGLKIDLTVTPHVCWPEGSDYTSYSEKSYLTPQGVLEIPVTVRTLKRHDFLLDLRKVPTFLGRWVRFFFPTEQWLLLDGCSVSPLIRLAHRCRSEGATFVHLTLTQTGLKRGPAAAVRQLAWFLGRTGSWWQGVSSAELFRSFQNSALKNNL